jgi:hypothetical protein
MHEIFTPELARLYVDLVRENSRCHGGRRRA